MFSSSSHLPSLTSSTVHIHPQVHSRTFSLPPSFPLPRTRSLNHFINLSVILLHYLTLRFYISVIHSSSHSLSHAHFCTLFKILTKIFTCLYLNQIRSVTHLKLHLLTSTRLPLYSFQTGASKFPLLRLLASPILFLLFYCLYFHFM